MFLEMINSVTVILHIIFALSLAFKSHEEALVGFVAGVHSTVLLASRDLKSGLW